MDRRLLTQSMRKGLRLQEQTAAKLEASWKLIDRVQSAINAGRGHVPRKVEAEHPAGESL